jgi:hypothetical protein
MVTAAEPVSVSVCAFSLSEQAKKTNESAKLSVDRKIFRIMTVGFICLIFDEYNEVQGRLPNPLSENKKSRIVESGFLNFMLAE